MDNTVNTVFNNDGEINIEFNNREEPELNNTSLFFVDNPTPVIDALVGNLQRYFPPTEAPFYNYGQIVFPPSEVLYENAMDWINNAAMFVDFGYSSLDSVMEESLLSDQEIHRKERVTVESVRMCKFSAETDTKGKCFCTEDYTEGDDLGILECGHVFHDGCIREWCHYKKECPVCRAEIR